MNFIDDGNPVWGIVIIVATFLPVTFLLALFGVSWFLDGASDYQQVLTFLLLPLLAPVAIALATPAYILYVVFVFVKRVKEPSYVSNHLDKLFGFLKIWSGKSRFAQPADLLKAFEAVLEANIQAMIGRHI